MLCTGVVDLFTFDIKEWQVSYMGIKIGIHLWKHIKWFMLDINDNAVCITDTNSSALMWYCVLKHVASGGNTASYYHSVILMFRLHFFTVITHSNCLVYRGGNWFCILYQPCHILWMEESRIIKHSWWWVTCMINSVLHGDGFCIPLMNIFLSGQWHTYYMSRMSKKTEYMVLGT